ncbi:MAG: C45 family peptidase [Isosphaeraceae bacterium]
MVTRREALQRLAAGLGVVSCSSTARAQSAVRPAAPFGDAATIAGGPRERGRRYGRQFGDAIREFLDREIHRAFGGSAAHREDLLRYAGACAGVIRAECPVIADELEGMAEATGLRLEEHVLLTLHEELYHRGSLPPISHCTAVAVGPPETRGPCFVGQTWDWMESVAGLSSVLHWQREEGPSVLAYAFPGLWVGAGLNSAGLALCWTSAELGKPKQVPRVGLPAYVLIAHLLYQPTLDAAADAARRDRHAGWFTFVMADGSGRLLNIEGSPQGVACEEAAGRLVRVGFGSNRMTGADRNKAQPRHPRCDTMDALLDRSRGRTDLEELKQDFGDPKRRICVGRSTLDMMIFDTTERTAHLSRGPEYGVAWREYRFAGSESER